MKIRDRIKSLRRVKASDLAPNPRNWRTHPEAQADALRGILAEVGFAGAALARETPDGLMLIDGHLRAELSPDAKIPVLVLDVTEAEADKILATFDPVGAMAEANEQALGELLASIEKDNAGLQAMLEELAAAEGLDLFKPGVAEEPPEAQTLTERFGAPPFSVLDARQGYWQDRKRAWLALGIQSEIGRGGKGAYPTTVSASDMSIQGVNAGHGEAAERHAGRTPRRAAR